MTDQENAARLRLLRKYRVSPDDRLSGGMEADVYACGPEAVLKLYAGATSFADLCTLRDFYAALERRLVPYALPYIHTVAQEEGFVVTIEQRLPGVRLSAVLPALTTAQMDVQMQRYLSAALALGQLSAPPTLERYKLFDPHHLSNRSDGDWRQFLKRYLAHKLAQVGANLVRDVPRFAARLQTLYTLLDQPYSGVERLIHGDFFPGNLLVNEQYTITALLDFGLLTMYGDPLFDIATGWVFFDMYDELKAKAREHYLAIVLERLGEQVRGKLYCYVLIYSILSANTYAAQDRTDGHYRWCVANLSQERYWDAIE